MSVLVAVAVAGVVAGSATIQSISGFGFALISVPLLAMLVDAKDAVVAASVFGLASSAVLLARTRGEVVWDVAGRLLAGAAAGMPLGLYVLIVVDERLLRALIASAVLFFVTVLASGATIRGRGRWLDVGAGFTSGVLNTSVSTNGPPLVLVLQARGLNPPQFRGTISATFVGSSILANVLLASAGRYTAGVGGIVVIGVPALVVGWVLGALLAPRLPVSQFRRLVLALLIVSAASALVSAAVG